MKTWLLLGMLLVGLCLSSCSKKSQSDRRDRTSEPDPATKPADPTKPAPPPRLIALDLGDEVTLKLTLIPAGKFMMGGRLSPAEVAQRFHRYGAREAYYTGEHPQREVTISKPFYMGVWEVTRPQWSAVMGSRPWEGKKCDRPNTGNIANHISWDDASKFCIVLSKKTGKAVVLPTEAQWEYACRAKSKGAYCFGDDESKLGVYAWYAANTLVRDEPYPHAAGQKMSNRWGLYDMHGNAAEWCRDWYAEKFYANANNIDPENTTETKHRAVRGGHWGLYPDSCRAAYRFKHLPADRKCSYGFRVVVAIGSGVE